MKKQFQIAQKAVVFRIIKGIKYILLIKYEDEFVDQNESAVVAKKYGFPGGRIDFGEDLNEAIVREVKEETGITVNPLDPIGLSS